MSSPDEDRWRHSPEIGAARRRADSPRARATASRSWTRRAGRPAKRRSNWTRRAPSPVTRIDQVGKPAPGRRRFPSANAIFEPQHGVDDDVEILVFGPARRTHDEADDASAHTEPREQRLPELLALARDRAARRPRPADRRAHAPAARRSGSRGMTPGRARPTELASTRRASRRSYQRASRPPDASGPAADAGACSRGCASR